MRPQKDPADAEVFAAKLFDEAQAAVRDFVSGSQIGVTAAAAFGPGVSGADVAAAVRMLDRKGWPKLVLVDEEVLHGARGAYDQAGDTVYLSRDFVIASRSAPAAIVAVLIEEIGHAIDARVNESDAAGDEGAIFADYVLGQPPSSGELAALKAENDRTAITIDGKNVAVEVAAPVVGSVTLDGSLADWSSTQQIDTSYSVSGYDIYGKFTGDSYVFALKAPVAIGANTTAWLNTDQNADTGYKIFGFAGGAEYNVNFDAAGTPRLYVGAAGQTLVSGATVSFGYSADKKIVEFAVAKSAIGSPPAINTLWDVNDSTFLPTDYSATQYAVSGSALPPRTDFTKKVGILYSDTSANKYFDKMAYSQLFMAAQNQATMAGVRYDVLTEADLTNLSRLVNYDALLFPSFSHVQSSQVNAIENTLRTVSQQYQVGLIASGEFMTYSQTGAALGSDPYARMKSLLGLNISGGGFPNDVVIKAGDITHPMMNDYATGEVIHNYDDVGWLAFSPTTSGARVLATQTVGAQTHNAVVATSLGGRNVHFSTEEVMADNNLLWQAIDYSVNGTGVSAGLQLSRQSSIVASRVDMDQAMEMFDVNPENGSPGIYDKLLPILQQWKTQYNYVGSYYVDIGNNPAEGQATDWSVSGPYYKSLIAMGNELGSHSITHPHNTNTLTAAQIQSEFQGSKQIIEQQMSQILGHPFVVDGAAVPGNPEKLATALSIIQYYNYLSGGFSGIGAGYPGAFGYLNPAMAAGNKVYLAPNVIFDFSLVEFQGMTPTQAAAEWQREWSELTSHSDVPVLLWPWHDYAAATWSVDPPAPSPYNVSMFTDFISKAFTRGAEFVTLDDLAERISSFTKSGVRTTVSGSTITATVTSAAAGKFALDLDNLGSQKIASVTNWYAYDDDSVFLPRAGGTYTINLGTAATDVTHITSLPMRAELLSLSGNGTNLNFSVIGEGKAVIDLVAPAGRQVTVTGATVVSLTGDKLTIDLGSAAQDNVSITLSSATANQAPTFTVADGKVTTVIGGHINTAHDLLLQPDGKIVMVGESNANDDRDFVLVRYNTNGSLDTSFDADGKVFTHFAASEFAHAVVRQADGKLVVAGFISNFPGGEDFAIARYNTNGSLDTTFADDGRRSIDFGSSTDVGWSVATQSDGKIVVAGSYQASGVFDFAVARLLPNGSLDATFDGDGRVRTNFAGASSDWATALAIQADGKIVVAGKSNNDFGLARYNASGTLDTTFSGDGRVTTALGTSDTFLRDIVLQPDGKILAVGSTFRSGSSHDIAVVRYNANGTLDTTFGGDGIVFTDIGGVQNFGSDIAVQADGRIIVAGQTENGFDLFDFALVRYNADGSVDGAVITDFGARGESASAVSLQADGKIVVGGTSQTNFAVARYNPDGSLDPVFDPVRVNTLNGAPTFTKGGAPVVLDADVRAFDADLAKIGHYGGASLSLARNGGANAQDVFSATGDLAALTQGGALIYDGVTVGTVTTNSSGRLNLAFNSAATQGYVDGVLQSIAYSNNSATPPSSVGIGWTFADGNTGLQGTGGSLAVSGSTTVTINLQPTITSNGGGTAATISIAENTTAVTTVQATDPTGQTITYSISAGVDAAKFAINAQSGALRFVAAPDFEAPTDQGINNVYNVTVRAQDGAGGQDTQALAVTVTNVTGSTINGDSAANTLNGTSEDDIISGLGGNDTLSGAGGNDRLDGGAGNDSVNGGTGNDVLLYGAGFDTLNGAEGSDTADFSPFVSAVWVDLAYSGPEAWTMDHPTLSGGPWRIIADLAAVENVVGTSGADYLAGDAGANRLTGGGGNDTLKGGAGDDVLLYTAGYDVLDGGTGVDTADFSAFVSAVWVDLTNTGGEAWTTDNPTLAVGSWRVIGDFAAVENIAGTNGADYLAGDAAPNRITGGAGNDTLTGRAGADVFVYANAGQGIDKIVDFQRGAGNDVLDLRAVLTGYTPGSSNPSSFVRLTQSGTETMLAVNADGTGTDFVNLAALQNNTGLVLNDLIANGNLLLA